MKLVVWLIFIVLVILAIRKKAKPLNTAMPEEVRSAPQSSVEAENMVNCAHCHVYLPASEAVHRGANVYCSTAHADLH